MTGGGIASGVSCSKKLPLRNVTARLHPLPTKWGNFGMPDRHRLVIVDDEARAARHGRRVSGTPWLCRQHRRLVAMNSMPAWPTPRPTCLILDVNMPGENGFEIARRVRATQQRANHDADSRRRRGGPGGRAGTGRRRLCDQAVRPARVARTHPSAAASHGTRRGDAHQPAIGTPSNRACASAISCWTWRRAGCCRRTGRSWR